MVPPRPGQQPGVLGDVGVVAESHNPVPGAPGAPGPMVSRPFWPPPAGGVGGPMGQELAADEVDYGSRKEKGKKINPKEVFTSDDVAKLPEHVQDQIYDQLDNRQGILFLAILPCEIFADSSTEFYF